MALTQNITAFTFRDKLMDRQLRFSVLTGPASYPALGDPVSPQNDFGLTDIHDIQGVVTDGTSIRILVYDRANSKLRYWIPNTGAEVAAAQNLSTFTGQIEVFGR